MEVPARPAHYSFIEHGIYKHFIFTIVSLLEAIVFLFPLSPKHINAI